MLSDPPSGNHRTDHEPPTGGAPTVGVVAPGPAARRLVAMLERAGLDAASGIRPAVGPARRRRSCCRVAVARGERDPPCARDASLGSARSRRRRGDSRRGSAAARRGCLRSRARTARRIDARPGGAGGLRRPDLLPARAHADPAASCADEPREADPRHGRHGVQQRRDRGQAHLSESTIKSHLHSAFTTIGVRSRKDAVALILDPNAGLGAGILAITDAGLSEDTGL